MPRPSYCSVLFDRVVIVTPRDRIAEDVPLVNRLGILRRFAQQGIEVMTQGRIDAASVLEDGVLRVRHVYSGVLEDIADVVLLTYATPRAPTWLPSRPSRRSRTSSTSSAMPMRRGRPWPRRPRDIGSAISFDGAEDEPAGAVAVRRRLAFAARHRRELRLAHGAVIRDPGLEELARLEAGAEDFLAQIEARGTRRNGARCCSRRPSSE